MAGSWLIASVNIDLTMHRSSAMLRRVRQQLADPRAALAVLRELEDRAGERNRRLVGRHAGQPLAAADRVGQLLAVLLVEQRLVVEQVLLRRPAALEQIDDPLRLRREVRPAGPPPVAAAVRPRAAAVLPAQGRPVRGSTPTGSGGAVTESGSMGWSLLMVAGPFAGDSWRGWWRGRTRFAQPGWKGACGSIWSCCGVQSRSMLLGVSAAGGLRDVRRGGLRLGRGDARDLADPGGAEAQGPVPPTTRQAAKCVRNARDYLTAYLPSRTVFPAIPPASA